MRLALKSTLILLSVYFVLLGGLALWLEYQLRSMAETLMEGTARIVGGEIAAAMSGSALEQLLQADPSARQRLEQILADLTKHSDVVASIVVVNEAGKVIASDDVEVGRQLAIPEVVFQNDKRVQFLGSKEPFHGGKYHLFVPLLRGDALVGYLRLSISSSRIAKLYQHAQRQLLAAAVTGLGLVLVLGVFFHVQLTRRSAALSQALEEAIRGDVVAARDERDEFSNALDTARKVGKELSEAREKTTDAQRRFATLMKVMDVGVILLGRQHMLDFANAPARELLGCSDPSEFERRWPELRTLLDEALMDTRIEGTRLDLEIPHGGRTTPLRIEVYPRDEDDGEGRLVLVKSREMLDALENELRLAIQMRGFARFYMAFAHDLKAPLNAMVLNLELLRGTFGMDGSGDAALKERQERYIAVLREEVVRLDRYLRTILTQATPASEVLQQFDLRELIQDLATLLSPQAKQQHVTLDTQVPNEPIRLTGHRDRLKQAMLNIAINALESMPDGGRMTLELSAKDARARIAIRDSGPGIPPELLGQIYGMHFTTKDGGTGIGLYVARSVVESHGGEIRVESEVGRGTCFALELPAEPLEARKTA